MRNFSLRPLLAIIAFVIGIIIINRINDLSFPSYKNKPQVKKTILYPPTYLKHPLAPTIIPLPSPTLPVPTIDYGYCLYVPVLLYHHIQPTAYAIEKKQTSISVDNEMFDSQMQYLTSHGYAPISAKQLIDALKSHSGLPSKSVVITIDDGYRDNYEYAFPILKKYNIVANIMVATGLMEAADYLTWSQIEEMGKSGLVFYTDHTWSHANLSSQTLDKIKFEIETAKQQLEQHTGQKIDIFTYPYGSYTATVEKVLQDDGFLGAFSTVYGSNQCESFIMNLHRMRIGNAPLSSYGF